MVLLTIRDETDNMLCSVWNETMKSEHALNVPDIPNVHEPCINFYLLKKTDIETAHLQTGVYGILCNQPPASQISSTTYGLGPLPTSFPQKNTITAVDSKNWDGSYPVIAYNP